MSGELLTRISDFAVTRRSCHRFGANAVRLQLSVLAYNLGNLWRRLVLPKRIDSWSLTGLLQRLVPPRFGVRES